MTAIVPRTSWGAWYADGYADAPVPAPHLILHHSATPTPAVTTPEADEHSTMRMLEAIGQQRFGSGMSYTFAVFPSGRIYQGVSIGRASAHTLNHNFDARAIVMVGNYQDAAPSNAMLDSIAWLAVHGHGAGWWLPSQVEGGHRDFERPGYTECPGDAGEASIRTINTIISQGENDVANSEQILAAINDVRTDVGNLYEVLEGRVPDGHGGYRPVEATDSHRLLSLPRLAGQLDSIVTMLRALTSVEAVERDHVEGIASQISVVSNDLAAVMAKLGVEPTG